MNYHAQLRADRHKQGLCVCGKFPLAEGKKQCQECLIRRNARNAKIRISGLCQCGRAVKPNFKKCDQCLTAAKKRREKFKQEGRCDCGVLSLKDAPTCQQCIDRKTARRREKVSAGFCGCGKPAIAGKKICRKCKSTRQNTYLLKSKTDQNFIARKRLRSCVDEAIKRVAAAKKIDRTEVLLGCTLKFARQHIESLFLPGMTWKNRKLWQIDHYIPCNAFDLTDARQQRLCNNWRNLRPLWTKDNRKKWFKLPIDYKVRLAELELHVPHLDPMNDPMF